MKAPFALLAGSLVAFAIFSLLYVLSWLNEGCGGTLPPVAQDVISIEQADLACLFRNAGEPDALIVSRCSPAGDSQKAQTIQVYLTICHTHARALAEAGE
jgi:hypothetical protein